MRVTSLGQAKSLGQYGKFVVIRGKDNLLWSEENQNFGPLDQATIYTELDLADAKRVQITQAGERLINIQAVVD